MHTSSIAFGKGVTAVVGANASGKSNLLNAVYLACVGELPNHTISETVAIGQTEGHVQARVDHEEGISTISVGLAPSKKIVRLDGQVVRTFELARVVSAVLITPEDAVLVSGSPAQRRGFLDSLLSRISPRYAVVLREYGRVLEQRNALLKTPYAAQDTLDVWSERLSRLGDEINATRRRAIEKIAVLSASIYQEIAQQEVIEKEEVEKQEVTKEESAKINKILGMELLGAEVPLREALLETRAEEKARGVTVVGPHRSDLSLTLAGHPIKAYGSRGEARTTALALKVASYHLLTEKHGEPPILLLDDFSAELDINRRRYLVSLVADVPQAIVTGTELPPQYDYCIRVVDGNYTACEPARD